MNNDVSQRSDLRLIGYGLFLAGLLCLGAVAPALAQDATTTVVTLTNSTYPANGYISVRVTDIATATVPTGTVTVTLSGVPQTVNLNAESANTAVGTTQIVSQAGTYAVSATYVPSSVAFAVSNDAGGNLVIAKATLTITADAKTITYGATPTFTAAITGYLNGDTAPVLGASGSQGATTSNATLTSGNPDAGSWTITPNVGTLASTNYAYAVATAALTVNRAVLTVTANSPTNIVYGTAAPGLSAAVTGQVNADGVGGYAGSALVTSSATTSAGAGVQNVGTWTTTAAVGTLISANYSFTYLTGSYSVTKKALTVTPGAVASNYGAAPAYTSVISGYVPGDNAGNSQGGAVSYSLPTATLTNSLPNQGSWPISAVVTGLTAANYSFVVGTDGTLTVSAVTLTVSAQTPTAITYGNATPTFTPSYTGLVNSDTAASALTGAPSYTNNATQTNGNPNAGTWASTPAVGSLVANQGNYTFAYTNGSFTVNKEALTLKADNATTVVYGNPFPGFTTTITGYVNADTSFTAYTGTPAVANVNATKTNGLPNAGTWNITPQIGTLASPNYTFTITSGTAIVSHAVLTITADPVTINYGIAPVFTTTITGAVNGENVNAIPGVSGTQGASTSNATLTNNKPNFGTWTITPAAGTLAAPNYFYSVATGTLTVNKVSLTISANSPTMNYGSTPTLTPNISGNVNGDTGTPSLTTPSATTSFGFINVGSYPVVAAAGTFPVLNYNVTYTDGTLTVNQLPITITALGQTVTYGTAFNSTPGAATVTVATLVAGDTGTPTLSADHTLAGSTFPNAGTWIITPAAGTISSTNYTITLVTAVFQVNKAALNVSAAPATITYAAATPIFTPTYTTFVTGDNAGNSLTGAPSFTDNATVTNGKPDAGGWNIVPALNGMTSANYTLTTVTATAAFTVNKAPLTVTAASPAAITYGTAFPNFTATYSTFVNGDTAAAVSGTASFSTNATLTNSNPNFGTWTVTPAVGSLIAANYSFTFVTGSITVNKALLSVNANSFQPITYGAAAPTFSYSVSGFVNSDNQAVVTGTAGFSSDATLTNGNPNVGTWTITPTQGTLISAHANYAFTIFTTGQFTVNKASLTISATSQSIVYGNAPSNAVSYNFVNGDTTGTAFTSGTPTVSNNANLTNSNPDVGTWTIIPAFNTLASNNYTLASATNGTLTVTPANLTVSAAPQTITYGTSQNLAPGATTVTVTGQVNGDSGAPSLSSSASLTNGNPNAGSWVITPAVGTLTHPANYNITYNTASLTVTKVNLTVRANSPANFTYGQASPVLSAAYTGLVNGDNSSAYTGTPTLTTNATVSGTTGFQNAGNWTVTVGSGSLTNPANYDIVLANGSYSVSKSALTITANGLSTVVGQAIPYSASVTGYVTSDTAATSFSGTITYTNNATLTNNLPNIGTWTITPVLTGLTSANYTLTPLTGTLTVRAAAPNPGGEPPPTSISLSAAPGSLTFTGPSGSVSPVPQSIQITSTPSVTAVTVTKGPAAWLTLTWGATTTPTTVAATVSVVGLVAGTYKETITVASADGTATALIPVTLVVTVSSNLSITQGASYGKGTAPNTAIAVFGAFSCPKPQVLAATVNGVTATIFASAATQINLAIPEIAATGYVPVQITCDGVVIGSGVTPIAAQAPGLFTLNYSGTGGGAILNQDYTVNGPQNGAKVGSFIAVYGTGFGALNPASPDGLQRLGATVTATIGGVDAPVVYAGETPGVTHALQQINVQIPANAPKGISVPIILTINGIATQTGVTVSIQ